MTNTELHPLQVDTYAVAPGNAEFLACVDILNQAAARLARRGVEQWPAEFDNVRIAKLAAHAEAGELMIIRRYEKALATIVVSEKADPDFAARWPSPATDALYLYRAAVSEAGRGLHLGHRVLVPLAESCARVKGKHYLRLDCSRRNLDLHRHYRDEWGFQRVGTAVVEGRKSGALFQRAVHWG